MTRHHEAKSQHEVHSKTKISWQMTLNTKNHAAQSAYHAPYLSFAFASKLNSLVTRLVQISLLFMADLMSHSENVRHAEKKRGKNEPISTSANYYTQNLGRYSCRMLLIQANSGISKGFKLSLSLHSRNSRLVLLEFRPQISQPFSLLLPYLKPVFHPQFI